MKNSLHENSFRNCKIICMILSLSLLLFLSGCPKIITKPGKPKKVALVLGGGGARGFAHVGVIRELESAGIPIDMIVGVSVGSLIGAIYADVGDSFELEWKTFKIKKKEIFDFKVFNIKESIVKGEAIKDYIDKNIGTKRIENMKVQLAIVATDIKTGTPVIFRSGPVKVAVRASSSVPGVFPPVPYGNKLLVDGGVLGNLAPSVAKKMGAEIIIGVSIGKARKKFSNEIPSALTVILESIAIMGDELIRLNREDFLIEPEVGDIGIMDFSKKKELIEAGRKATRKHIGKIKKAVITGE
ncbi:MAG: patatin-like phospholipase family protein [Deltaproteobacteria bacterium]|nr:patatin-like phospholipase family protein [Deltaproteobacteria bacterium]